MSSDKIQAALKLIIIFSGLNFTLDYLTKLKRFETFTITFIVFLITIFILGETK